MDAAIKDSPRIARKEFRRGVVCVLVVLMTTLLLTGALVVIAYVLHPIAGMAVEAILTGYCLATRSLQVESMKVYKALKTGDTEKARYAVSMIVGRDTKVLDEKGIIRAAVETVAENTSDGIIAPMLYLIVGGPILGMTYKAINTMDSMIAYHNERYENFGKCAARLDDVANFLPARISAVCMIVVAYVGKGFDGKQARTIFLRDRFQHKSPNSAQTESACAGALHVQLAGDAYYFGQLVKKPFIGNADREIEQEDIRRVHTLMFGTMFLLFIIGVAILIGVGFLVR